MTPRERMKVAIRYTFPSGRGHLSTFLSSLSMIGLVLAIGLLIIVLSVMNGFDKEMRDRILALVPHVSLYSHYPIEDWQTTAEHLAQHPEVLDVAPFTQFDTLIIAGDRIESAAGVGLDAQDEAALGRLLSNVSPAEAQAFRSSADALVLGADIAGRLEVEPGARVTLVVPGTSSADGPAPTRFESLTVTAILDTGTELDQALALIPLSLASELAGVDGEISGFRISTSALFDVHRIGWELSRSLEPGYYSTNWMMTHGNLYAAIQLSRDLVTILLFSIIAVAAFNVVSSLVLVVFDKQGNIAILRTLGASGSDIAWIFLLQGGLIGVVGVVMGTLAGALGSLLVPRLVTTLEGLLQMRFLNTDVYPVSFVPVDLRLGDLVLVGAIALLMCVLAAIYPARRAASLAPALVLNHDH
ncbi:MAG: FtsX-like permease family protein [Pseudomonadota bacterium]